MNIKTSIESYKFENLGKGFSKVLFNKEVIGLVRLYRSSKHFNVIKIYKSDGNVLRTINTKRRLPDLLKVQKIEIVNILLTSKKSTSHE